MVLPSILVRQEQGGGASVRLGDDPKRQCGADAIRGEQALSAAKCIVIGGSVPIGEIAPITGEVAGEVLLRAQTPFFNEVRDALRHDELSAGKANSRTSCNNHGGLLKLTDRGHGNPTGLAWPL